MSTAWNPTPSQTTINAAKESNTVTLVFVDPNRKNDHYATIPFPKTYEDAAAMAVKTLGRYMDGDASNIILRRSAMNRKGEWIWADISPEHWRTTVGPGMQVAIFKQPRVGPEVFVHGPVHFTYFRDDGRGIAWSALGAGRPNPHLLDGMDRPESFADAVKTVRAKLRLEDGRDTFTFCIFQDYNLSAWHLIPKSAHADDALWRKFVPLPGEILGVIVNRKV